MPIAVCRLGFSLSSTHVRATGCSTGRALHDNTASESRVRPGHTAHRWVYCPQVGSIILQPGVIMSLPSFDGWTCPVPLQNYPTIVMGHGAGGKMMNDLIRHLFAAEFNNDLLGQLADATTIEPES